MHFELVKIKNPVEHSFQLWICNYPESTHPSDEERFLKFVKNVCVYNARKWKDPDFLRKKVLTYKPNFNEKKLEQKLLIYEKLIDFHKVKHTPRTWSPTEVLSKIPSNSYIERGWSSKEGFYEKIFKRT